MTVVLPERTERVEIVVPTIPAELLDRILESDERFQLSVHEGLKTRGREPLWIPYWPTKPGQRVESTQPSVFHCTDKIWHLTSWSVTAGGELLWQKSDSFPTLRRGDSLHLSLVAWS